MSWFFDGVPYLLAVGTILLGALEIKKDWNDYQTSKLRIVVASAFIVVAVGDAFLVRDWSMTRSSRLYC